LFGVHGTYARFDGHTLKTASGDPVSVGMADVTSATTIQEYRKTHPKAQQHPPQAPSGGEVPEALTDEQKAALEPAGRNDSGTIPPDEAKRLADEARMNAQK
jgi:hypothetical protein